MSPFMALTDEQPSMDSTAAIRGAADVGGLARPAGRTVENDPSLPFEKQFCCDAQRGIPTTMW
jgi:hypothetical protein